MKKKRDPYSEQSVLRARSCADSYTWRVEVVKKTKGFEVLVHAQHKETMEIEAIVKLSEYTKKRQPLTGIKAVEKKLKKVVG